VTQSWSPQGYAENARFVAELGVPLLALLAPRPGERILDVGCGDGFLTKKIAECGACVVGVDSSAEMVLAARALGLDARVQSGEALGFVEEFDAVFSNAALHWMKRPDAAIDGIFRALRAGGRFVAELGGEGCIRTIREAIEHSLEARGVEARAVAPWYFPSAHEYAERLQRRGFVVRRAECFDRPTPLPTGVRGWLSTFAGPYLDALPESKRADVLTEVEERVTPVLRDTNGVVHADYVRLRVVAQRPQ
jgi:trans-aconitate methyltransferase